MDGYDEIDFEFSNWVRLVNFAQLLKTAMQKWPKCKTGRKRSFLLTDLKASHAKFN